MADNSPNWLDLALESQNMTYRTQSYFICLRAALRKVRNDLDDVLKEYENPPFEDEIRAMESPRGQNAAQNHLHKIKEAIDYATKAFDWLEEVFDIDIDSSPAPAPASPEPAPASPEPASVGSAPEPAPEPEPATFNCAAGTWRRVATRRNRPG